MGPNMGVNSFSFREKNRNVYSGGRSMIKEILFLFSLLNFFISLSAFAERKLAGQVTCRTKPQLGVERILSDPRDFCPVEMKKDCKSIYISSYSPPEWKLKFDLDNIEYFPGSRDGIVAKGDCYAERGPNSCLGANVSFPIKIDGRNYYCGDELGRGFFGKFFGLVDENLKDSKFGIKIFHSGEPKYLKEELDDINFFRKYIKSIPEVIQYSIPTDPKDWKKNSNYIIKKRIDGTDLNTLYGHGCFLQANEIE
jgi:hypothetical protein